MTKSLLVSATLASLTLACGGSGGGGDGGITFGSGGSGGNGASSSCNTFTPCGGSVLGTWTITKVCMSTADAGAPKGDAACSTTSGTPNLEYSGTFTFRSDGTFTADLSVVGSGTLTYSAGCFASTFSCSSIDSVFKNPGVSDAGMSGSCTSGASGSCTCNETFNMNPPPTSGTYTTSGSTITSTSTTSSSSSPEVSDYCVQGNTLMLRSSSNSTQSSILVATK